MYWHYRAGHHRRGLTLHSSRFERVSESELDQALEAIKEESREGSVSPTRMEGSVSHTHNDQHIEFSWEAMSNSTHYNNEMLMEQLKSISIQHLKYTESNSSLLSSKTVASDSSGSKAGDGDRAMSDDVGSSKPVYLDLRQDEQVMLTRAVCVHMTCMYRKVYAFIDVCLLSIAATCNLKFLSKI